MRTPTRSSSSASPPTEVPPGRPAGLCRSILALSQRLGTLSLLLGVGLFLANAVAWGVFVALAVGIPGWGNSDAHPGAVMILGPLVLLTVLGHPLGLALGIAGLVRREPRPLLSVLGVALNALLILGLALVALLSILGASV